jgi:hypothetical protein
MSKAEKTMKEKDIKHENGNYWVLDTKKSYAVMKNGVTHSVSDSEYPRNSNGLSIAIYRCNYLAKKEDSNGHS